jgi:hypothetical protein
MAYIVEEIAPLVEPVSRGDMKNWLKIPPNVTNDDLLIDEITQSAREEVEGWTARSLVNKGYRQVLDSFPYFVDTIMSQQAYPPSYYSLPRYSTTLWNYSQMIKLLRGPLVAISRISYTDSNNNPQSFYPALFNWQSMIEVSLGYQIEDPNGNLQVVTAVAESDENGTTMTGATQPTWATGVGLTTTDNGVTWTCKGPVPDAGDFIYDRDSMPPRIFPLPGQTWPPVLYVPNAVQIHFTAGYGNDGAAVPAGLKQLMRKLAWDAYYNREPVSPGTIATNPSLARLYWRWKMPVMSPTRG